MVELRIIIPRIPMTSFWNGRLGFHTIYVVRQNFQYNYVFAIRNYQ